jgi:hypothetical protein
VFPTHEAVRDHCSQHSQEELDNGVAKESGDDQGGDKMIYLEVEQQVMEEAVAAAGQQNANEAAEEEDFVVQYVYNTK